MGQVWVVRQDFLRREFALKILHPRFGTKPAVIDRLRFEAQATARIEHPGIVNVIDFWIHDDGHACFVMELLNGVSLAERIKSRGRLPALEVVEIGCQTLSALVAAHACGIIHRDIKPENLFLHQLPGQSQWVKLLDFGLARLLSEFGGPDLAPPLQRTRTGTKVGTARYLSPEAARGSAIDQRSDLFSLGVTLYEALAGEGPFDRPIEGTVPKPSEMVPGVAPALDECLLTAIQLEAANRFQSAADFECALRRLLPNWHQGVGGGMP